MMPSSDPFALLAAIDLRGGRVVRLRQGDFARETAYGDDPIAVARDLVDRGAAWLHVVDLDGARSGRPRHASIVQGITEAIRDDARVEVAGGIRSHAAIEHALAAGAARVVLGTAAVRDADFARQAVADFGADRLCVALDVRAERVLVDAWIAGGDAGTVQGALTRLVAAGITTFEVTAVERDGTLEGPDLPLLARLARRCPGRIIASGGIRSVEDVLAIRDAGCAGAIVGRAIYDGRLDLAAAKDAVDGDEREGRPTRSAALRGSGSYATSERRPDSTS
jgi:phosphoribosylformimino-5-aminoimidazole carboxamide ribotide isomerase